MPTTFANTINSNPIYADRAVHDAAGNDIQTTYATKSELPSIPVTDVEVDGVSVVSSGVASITMPTIPVTDVEVDGVSVVSSGVASITSPTVDQTYNSASTNAQSGTAVAGAIAGVNQVPSSTSSDADKVLTVNSQGVPGWATAQVPQSKPVVAGSNITITENTNNVTISASGMTQLQSNWNETSSSSPQYIQNKPNIPVLPTTKPVVAGSNITITENTNDVTISATGGTTYSAGTGIDITSNVISVDTPVDIVAGPGIVIDNPDGNTLRVSQASNYEVTLWSGTYSGSVSDSNYITLSENPANFDTVEITIGGGYKSRFRFAGDSTTWSFMQSYANTSSTTIYAARFDRSTTTITCKAANYMQIGANQVNSWQNRDMNVGELQITKVVGIHRIAGGN